MAKDFDNENRGVLFKEADKESEKHPDYTGKLNVNGTDYYLAGWIRESKKGAKFLSLSIKPATGGGRRTKDEDQVPF